MREVGFFRELDQGDPSGPSIHEHKRQEADPHEDQIAAYLESGIPILGGSGTFRALGEPEQVIAVFQLVTDGEWVWRSDLPYYVRLYHLALPAELLERMERNQWRVPRLSNDEVAAISRAWVFKQR